MNALFDRVQGGNRMIALALLFVVLGTIALVRSVAGFFESNQVEISTELLLLPGGVGILLSSTGWLRFARALVALTFVITILLVAMGVFAAYTGMVSVAAFAGSSAPLWRIIVVGAVYLVIEGTALTWMSRELTRRNRSVH